MRADQVPQDRKQHPEHLADRIGARPRGTGGRSAITASTSPPGGLSVHVFDAAGLPRYGTYGADAQA